jgi:NADH dehydrogenase [ubiquinone] 1 alpha subcomplex assembly factor 5
MNKTNVPEIFDRKRRRTLLNRADPNSFLWQHMADALTDQLGMVSRAFSDALFIGPIGHHAGMILSDRESQRHYAPLCDNDAVAWGTAVIEEDRIPFAAQSYDLIISAGTLDSVNDLPGALVQIRRALRPDGLFLCVMFGSATLGTMRNVLMKADGDKTRAHIHPQIDLRTAADLLSRTGFALPVADVDTLNVRYSNWRNLVLDIRATGTGNALVGDRAYMGKTWVTAIEEAWDALKSEQGKVTEQFIFLNLSAWSPSPDQQKPARRGSGTVSLADALSRKKD